MKYVEILFIFIDNIVATLFIAWIFSLFNIDKFVINGLKEIFKVNISSHSYYFTVIMLAIIGTIVEYLIL